MIGQWNAIRMTAAGRMRCRQSIDHASPTQGLDWQSGRGYERRKAQARYCGLFRLLRSSLKALPPAAKSSLAGRVRLNDHIPFLLYRLASQLSIEANAQFKALGVNTLSSRVLLVLLTGEAETVGDLSTITAIDQSTLSHILIRLCRKGLTIKRKAGCDSRIVNVRLTAKGRKVARRCREIGLQFAEITTASMTASQKEDLRGMLKDMYRNLVAATHEG